MTAVIKMENVSKSFQKNIVLDNLNLEVEQGELVAIIGKSGCGKSTLLNILGLLDKASKGKVEIFDQQSIRPFSRKAEKLLHDKIGYLFQNYALIENETIEYNLNIVFDYRIKKEERKQKIAEALDQVGLKGMEKKKVYQCSGGEQQRIALARLLIKPCQLILADEPTGALDSKSAKMLLDSLNTLNQKLNATILMVTHDCFTASYGDLVIFIKDGKLFSEVIKGEHSRKEFFNMIMDVQTVLGGELNELI